MKKAIVGLVFCSMGTFAFSQQAGNADINAVLNNMKRITDSFNNSRKTQQMLKDSRAANVDSIVRAARAKSGVAGSSLAFGALPVRRPDTTTYKLPPRNTAALRSLPARPLSTAELKIYLLNLDKKLSQAFHQSLQTPIVNIDDYDPTGISNEAALAASAGFLDQAILLAIKAAEREPDNPCLLNNAGAILQEAGAGVPAITLLMSALQIDSGSSTVENNLGQAYLTLGDRETAQKYLHQCIRQSTHHPLANSSLALIEIEKGDRGAALQHTENSLKGAFTDKGWHLLYKLKKEPVLMDYYKQRYKQPEYFDEIKYPFPPQCENVNEIPVRRGEYRAYHEMLDNLKHKFEKEASQEDELGKAELQQQLQEAKGSDYIGKYQTAFLELAVAMTYDISARMERDDIHTIEKIQQQYDHDSKLFQEAYDQDTKKNTKNCAAEIGFANEYLMKMAKSTRQYQLDYMHIMKAFYLDNAFWSFFTTSNTHLRRFAFCRLTVAFLAELQKLGISHFSSATPNCQPASEQKKRVDDIQIQADCPWKDGIEIPFLVAKYTLDCDKQEIEFGEGIVFNLSRKLNSGEVVLAAGPGVNISLIGHSHESVKRVPGLEQGLLKAGVDAGIKGQLYLDFLNGSLVDYGGTFSAELDVMPLAREFKTGYTLGVNSGLNMEPGILKNLIDDNLGPPKKEAPQLNKNVKKYSPK